MSCKRKRDETRNCYTRTICDEKLEKAQARLQCLIDKKSQLECELERWEIQCIDEKIVQLECKIEKMASNHAAEECKNRMKEEICMIKDQRKKAEIKVRQYKKKICEKIIRLQNCKNSNGCPPTCGGGSDSPEEEDPCGKKKCPSSSSDSDDNGDDDDEDSDICSSDDKCKKIQETLIVDVPF